MNEKTVKAVFKCPEEYKSQFKNSKCLLTVSVGQEFHEGEKFTATLDLVNNAFSSCTICVDDSLQRYSMGLFDNTTPESWYDASIIEGDKWIERNQPFYEKLDIPYEVIRWDKWLDHPDFADTRQLVLSTYQNDQTYQDAINHSVEEFLARFTPRADASFNREYGFNLCKDYLFEECTALCLWMTEGYNFEVYPSKRNSAMTETHERFVKPSAPNLVNAVSIKFKNRKQSKPQEFFGAAESVA